MKKLMAGLSILGLLALFGCTGTEEVMEDETVSDEVVEEEVVVEEDVVVEEEADEEAAAEGDEVVEVTVDGTVVAE